MSSKRIRNFSIIAHIDHGKSTLADRFLERTGAISPREMRDQILDSMDIERERGITIKAQAVRLDYADSDGQEYVLNLIDTPGHVDFSYEVSRSLAACEGALLLVDASQGVEAQTLANAYLAIEAGLEIIPVVNKIDLPAADPERVSEEVAHVLGVDPADVILVSAKRGEGVDRLLERIVADIPPPAGDADAKPRALIFDSFYDAYRGVVAYIRVVDGTIRDGDKLLFAATEDRRVVTEVGVLRPAVERVAALGPGEVGYLITGVKTMGQIKVGDTILAADDPNPEALPGYTEPRPMVFSGMFPSDGEDFERLREALDKLKLNDASLMYEPETSRALGFGFRTGFLGLLHMDIVRERLEREYGLDLVTTAPSVAYRVKTVDGEEFEIRSPQDLPEASKIASLEEPYVRSMILAPTEYIGTIMELVISKRGLQVSMSYLSPSGSSSHTTCPSAKWCSTSSIS